MRNSFIMASLCCGALMAATPAQATVFVFTASLSGAEEVPPVVSPGFGTAVVTLDDSAFTMRVQASFADLIGNTAAAHIHCCAPSGVNVGVASMTPSFTGFPLGVTAGSMDQTFDMTNAASFNAGFIAVNGGTTASAFTALKAGLQSELAYFNVHTTAFPGGEIRGQFAAVPEPASWALMMLGFGAVGAAMRRRPKVSVRYA